MNVNNLLGRLGLKLSERIHTYVLRVFTVLIWSGMIVSIVGGCASTKYRYEKRAMPFSEFSQDPAVIKLVKTMNQEEAIEIIRESFDKIGLYSNVTATDQDVSWIAVESITIHQDSRSRRAAYVPYRVVVPFDIIEMVEVSERIQVVEPSEIGTVYGWSIDLHLAGVPKKGVITHQASGAQSTITQNPANISFYHSTFSQSQMFLMVKLESGEIFSYPLTSKSFPIEEAREMKNRFLAALLVLRPGISTPDMAGIK